MTKKWLGPVLIVLALLASAAVFDRLPEQVPTHWNWRGEVNDTTARFPGAFLAPLIAAALWILLPVLRRVDPRRRNYERFDETFWILLNLLAIGMVLLHAITLLAALGYDFDTGRAVLAGVGFLFVALGNYLPRLRSNWWMGIRTPWTLESEDVWRRTHRLAGRTFVLGGAACMLGALFLPRGAAAVLGVLALGGATVVPLVYSYVIFRREAADRR